MKFYIDTEFLEGTQKRRFLGIPLWNTKPTIDLISIGVVSENGEREYYGICKDFNLREAWHRFQIERRTVHYDDTTASAKTSNVKVYWLRENVLKPVFDDLVQIDLKDDQPLPAKCHRFTLRNMRSLLDLYGQSREEIAEELKQFVYEGYRDAWIEEASGLQKGIRQQNTPELEVINDFIKRSGPVRFCGYYSDYDWVAICWLFGKMMDLPTSAGFPMYCYDLKQKLDDTVDVLQNNDFFQLFHSEVPASLEEKLKIVKQHHKYPDNPKEHSALHDASWTRLLDHFIDNHLK